MEEKWHKKQRACYLFSWVFVVLCIACVLGLIVCIVVFGLKKDADGTLLLILTVSAAAGTVIFAIAGVGLSKLSLHYALRERDVKELAVSEDSFFAGEGTFATFQKEGVLLHSVEQGKTKIFVPYSEMRVFTVCTRARAREKGEWSVVLEIPMRYLSKDKKAQKQSPPALIELTYKPRLVASLQKYGVAVLGEEKGEEGKEAFEKIAKFTRPVPEKRKLAFISVGVGVALLGAGLALLFTVSVPNGAILTTFGFLIAARGGMSLVTQKTVVAVYREGIFWRSRKGEPHGTFLKWTEIKRIYVREEEDEESVLVLDCGYGAYDCPLLNGVSACVLETVPDLVEEEL